ncbi:cupin domain-containing protein [Pseudomonas laurylsulfatiphila]|jgi:quercetin dioxygenase-like cupin family protein|uniref:cupin domain-containing protein n=1 Tax=Pseudomonas laurylsulfatiphila TaxID=2011015 RepID=UPI003D09BF2B
MNLAQALLHNWNDLPRETVRKGVERVGFRGDDTICVMNWLTPGMDVFPHSHTFEQLVIIVQGRVRFHLGDEVVEGGPGSMLRIPPHVVHYAEPLGDEVVMNLDVFSPLRGDYQHLVEYQANEFGSIDTAKNGS